MNESMDEMSSEFEDFLQRYEGNERGRGEMNALLQATEMESLTTRLNKLEEKVGALETSLAEDHTVIAHLLKHSKLDKASIATANERIRELELKLKVQQLRRKLEINESTSSEVGQGSSFSPERLATKINQAVQKGRRLRNFEILAAQEKCIPLISVPPEPKRPAVQVVPVEEPNSRNNNNSGDRNSGARFGDVSREKVAKYYRKLLPDVYKKEVRIVCQRLFIDKTPISVKELDLLNNTPSRTTKSGSIDPQAGFPGPSYVELVDNLEERMEVDAVDDSTYESLPAVLRDHTYQKLRTPDLIELTPTPQNTPSESGGSDFGRTTSDANDPDFEPSHNDRSPGSKSRSSGEIETDSDFEVIMEDSTSFKNQSDSSCLEESGIEDSESVQSGISSMTITGSEGTSGASNASKIVNKECPVCHKIIKYSYNFKRHLRKHKGRKDLQCKLCHRSFSTDSEFLEHQNKSHSLKEFPCESCSKTFGKIDHLNSHMKSHQGSEHSCPECGKTFSQRSNLKTHLLTHGDEKPFECHICDQSFRLKKTLKSHLKLHGVARGRKFSCQFCDIKFFTEENCEAHMSSEHREGEENQKGDLLGCDHCERKFKHSKSLLKHINFDHAIEQNFGCEICHKACLTVDGLRRHMKSHGFDTQL